MTFFLRDCVTSKSYQKCVCLLRFGVATSGAEAEKIATDLKTKNLILKAQVLAGGRGKGHFKNGLKGGVRVINKYVLTAFYMKFNKFTKTLTFTAPRKLMKSLPRWLDNS